MPGSYAARQPPAKEGEKPVTVLVTGFGVSEHSKHYLFPDPLFWTFRTRFMSYSVSQIVY
jgi:hypothetical protein